jgi:anti-sigma factor RsiW
MTCRQVVELMTEYLEGNLPAGDRTRFEEHIAGCDGCRAYLAQLQTTREMVGRIANEPMPASVERELIEAFRNWRRA